jgi:hypothetical protein
MPARGKLVAQQPELNHDPILPAHVEQKMLTHERLREVLNYDPETGIFTRRIDLHKGRHKAGQRTGTQNNRFRFQWIDDRPYLEHRIAWFWMTGNWPKHQIDHKNLNAFDNRWANLREATVSQNAMNRKGRSKSGAKGVYFIADKNKCGSKPWRVHIMKEGKRHYIGLFSTLDEAKAAHAVAATRLHGEFARLT